MEHWGQSFDPTDLVPTRAAKALSAAVCYALLREDRDMMEG
jgi:hypothetical protein